jgi:hypothetical protein
MNRRRHTNTVPVAALVRWVVVAFFLCTVGLCYVYFKNEMQTRGTEIRNLESELSALRAQDDTERAQIDKLSSHSYLERRLAEGFIQLTPITDDRIVRVHLPGSVQKATAATADAGDEIQRVSNRIATQ